jgi:uncharacterized protein (DUF885 family)
MQASEPFFYDGLIFDQMNGIQSFVPTFLINFHRVDTQQDMEAYIQRVEAVAPRMQEAIEIASKGLAKGVISHTFALDGVIKQTNKVISGQPFDPSSEVDSDLWADIKSEISALQDAGTIDGQTAEELTADAKAALLGASYPPTKTSFSGRKMRAIERRKKSLVWVLSPMARPITTIA